MINKNINNQFLYKLLIIFFFMISLIPFNCMPVTIIGFQLHHLLIALFVSVLLVLSWSIDKRFTAFDKCMLIVIGVFSLSLITSVNRVHTLHTIASYILKGFGVAFVAERAYKEKKNLDVLLLCAVIVAIIGLVEFVFHWNPFFRLTPLLVNFSLLSRSGMASTIGHPIAVSGYLILFFGLSLFYVNSRKTFYRGLPLILISLTIFLSFSRSSWISAVFVILFYLFSENRKIFLKNWRIYIILIIVLVLPFIFSPKLKSVLYSRTNKYLLKREVVSSHRSASYKTVGNILRKYPLFGVGLGNYPQVHEKYRAQGTSSVFKTPDNIYLRLLSETGIIGLISFLAFIIYWLFRLWQRRNNLFEFSILAGLVGFLVNQMAADLFYWTAPQVAFWMLFGIGIANLNQSEKSI